MPDMSDLPDISVPPDTPAPDIIAIPADLLRRAAHNVPDKSNSKNAPTWQGLSPALIDWLDDRGTILPDPGRVQISGDGSGSIMIGTGNTLHPGTRIHVQGDGHIRIGHGNIFQTGCHLRADGGHIDIGNHNLLGDGDVTLLCQNGDDVIRLHDHGRYIGQIHLCHRADLGSGSQILGRNGMLSARDITLGAGQSHLHPIADQRGAVLKGYGTARAITLARGQVIAGAGMFDPDLMRMQSFYHPDAK